MVFLPFVLRRHFGMNRDGFRERIVFFFRRPGGTCFRFLPPSSSFFSLLHLSNQPRLSTGLLFGEPNLTLFHPSLDERFPPPLWFSPERVYSSPPLCRNRSPPLLPPPPIPS